MPLRSTQRPFISFSALGPRWHHRSKRVNNKRRIKRATIESCEKSNRNTRQWNKLPSPSEMLNSRKNHCCLQPPNSSHFVGRRQCCCCSHSNVNLVFTHSKDYLLLLLFSIRRINFWAHGLCWRLSVMNAVGCITTRSGSMLPF